MKDCKKEVEEREEKPDESIIKTSVAEQAFFKLLFAELYKVTKTYRALEIATLKCFPEFIKEVEKLKKSKSPRKSEISQRLKECAEHHLQIVLIENYAVMNYCGFTKILKKHDKVTGFTTREKYMLKMVHEQPFAVHSKLEVATKLILKEFYLLQDIRQGVKNEENEKKINESIKLSQDTKATRYTTVVENSCEQTKKNRLDDLVDLLEKHQKELVTEENDKKRKIGPFERVKVEKKARN